MTINDQKKTIEAGATGVRQIYDMLTGMKEAVKAGTMTLADYQDQADPLVKKAAQITGDTARGGSSAANTVNPIWQKFQDDGFVMNGNGKWVTQLPFSRQEYAKLPDSVLPTQADINSGMFDPTNAPLQRVRQGDQQPAVNPGVNSNIPGNNSGTTPGAATPNHQTGNSPIFTAAPDNPPPYGGLASTNSQASFDAQRVAQEGALQQQLSTQSQEGITAKRAAYLKDLTGLVNDNVNKQMSEATPGILEDLNSRGLLRSTGTGEALATKAKSLNADAANQLAQYGIQGETADLGNYQTIQNNYNDSRNTALNREFSVEDYNKQVQTGKELGEQYASLKPAAVNSGKGAQIGTVVGGVGGAFAGGPAGAAAGAQIGGAAGGASSGGKGH